MYKNNSVLKDCQTANHVAEKMRNDMPLEKPAFVRAIF
jgi:hypothetical protein